MRTLRLTMWGDTARMMGEAPEATEEERVAERQAWLREELKRRGLE